MDRQEFLKLCQIASMLKYTDIPKEYLVEYNGTSYYPYGYEMKFQDGYPVHKAIIHDMNANCVLYVGLEEIIKRED